MSLLYAFTVFITAGLLFVVQPMTAKGLLPLLGGSPSVWTTSMLFFQAALLVGYGWAHWVGTRRGRVWPVVVHAAALAGAAGVLVWRGWRHGEPPGGELPIGWLLGELALAVGPAFVVLAAAGPLAQAWYARTGRPDASDPYHLYAASNAGSLAGLLGYPLLGEPALGLGEQRQGFTAGFVLAAALVIACGISVALRGVRRGSLVGAEMGDQGAEPADPWRQRLVWLALAFVPSSLMLGATSYLSTDVAAFPLLWALPLSIYLVTFVVAFGRGRKPGLAWLSRLGVVVLTGVIATFLLDAKSPLALIAPLHLVLLAVGALVCHLRLAGLRPHPSRLTEFYLVIAAGGALGGLFNGVVAPLVFEDVHEYPITLVLLCLCFVARRGPGPARRAARDWLWPIGLLVYAGVAGAFIALTGLVGGFVYSALIAGVPLVLVYLGSSRPSVLAASVAVLLAGDSAGRGLGSGVDLVERTFFGVHRVETLQRRGDEPAHRRLMHGTTVHGVKLLAKPSLPTSYYYPDGPAGSAMRGLAERAGEEPLEIALVGMGVGAMAAYARPGDRYRFYEIDPAVVRIAQDPSLFSFLELSRGEIGVEVGDGRLGLASAAGRYDAIVLDAFSSDAIPAHLLTVEAFELYRSRLKPGGALLAHLSNVHLDLPPVVAAVADELGMVGRVRHDEGGPDFRAASTWAVLAEQEATLDAILEPGLAWEALEREPGDPLWTDAHSDLVRLIRWD